MSPPAARVWGFVATEADVCVLLRRGPSKKVLMVRWDLATDEFEFGQWLRTDLKPERSALSPDGRLFASYVLDYRQRPTREEGPHVSVSRPPYFTALAFWWAGGMHTGGARWLGNRTLALDRQNGTEPDKGVLPRNFQVRPLESYPYGWWAETANAPSLERARLANIDLESFCAPQTVGKGGLSGEMPRAKWADVDHRGRLLLARKGKIYVRDRDAERELIDLNPLEFRPLEAPDWAKEWPE